MSDPVTFATDQLGRTEARMGERVVGVIETWPARMGKVAVGERDVRAVYRMYLPIDGAMSRTRPAPSVQAARRGLLQWLAGWFAEAGPHCDLLTHDIVLQAFNEGLGKDENVRAVHA